MERKFDSRVTVLALFAFLFSAGGWHHAQAQDCTAYTEPGNHLFALGRYPTFSRNGIKHWDLVIDVNVENLPGSFSLETASVRIDSYNWFHLGWIKGDLSWGYTDRPTFFYEKKIEGVLEGGFILDFGFPGHLSSHQYEISWQEGTVKYPYDMVWNFFIDGQEIGYLETLHPKSKGKLTAFSESTNDCNELQGHYWSLKYGVTTSWSTVNWYLWNNIYTEADPPYWVDELSTHEFCTGGPGGGPEQWFCP